MKLSVIVPAYNERHTIGAIIPAITAALPGVPKEIVVVDDGSTDGTRDWLTANLARRTGAYAEAWLADDGRLEVSGPPDGANAPLTFKVVFHEKNQGKGGALRTGFGAASGDVVVVQDADLEYDPEDWSRMYPLIAERRVADVVYGSRFFTEPHRSLYFHHYMGNRLISLLFNLMYNQTLSDIEVCYKMFTREVLDTLRLTCTDFGVEVQLSAQIARAKRWRIYEVGISYYGRTYAEGKKINWRDGVKALWYLVKFRVEPAPA